MRKLRTTRDLCSSALAKLTGADVKGIPDSVTPEKKKKEKQHKPPHTIKINKTKPRLKEKAKKKERNLQRTIHRRATRGKKPHNTMGLILHTA